VKFYKYFKRSKHLNKIFSNKLDAIFQNLTRNVYFYKNGFRHNSRNAAYINYNGYKEFILNNKSYHNKYVFTKQSWRKFVKIQVFL